MVSYLTFIGLTLYLSRYSRYLMRKLCDLHQGRFKVIQDQKTWCQSIAHGWFPIRLLLTTLSYMSPFSKYLACNSNDLELGLFKVIHGQRSWCQSIAHRWFPIRLLFTPTSYLSPFLKYLTCSFNVQCHPRSKAMVSLESPLMVSYLIDLHCA